MQHIVEVDLQQTGYVVTQGKLPVLKSSESVYWYHQGLVFFCTRLTGRTDLAGRPFRNASNSKSSYRHAFATALPFHLTLKTYDISFVQFLDYTYSIMQLPFF